ncbi:MAG TPA: SwmB domain-containing protein [Pseudonocardiaceae bacterium]|nr:SwmB domain-containing protein [Pseudonocardiaceae bacterium]
MPNPLPPLAFSTVEGGFTTTANFADTSGSTHGWSYVATRTSPTPLTCANQGFWTNPGNGVAGPVAANPVGKPDTPPALTGATEADAGANDALLQFDQEMLDTAQGVPATSRFQVLVDGVARTVTGVSVTDDVPPANAIVDVTFDGLPLTSGQTVSVLYRKPLTAGLPQLQDLDNLETNSFGPVSIPAF